VCLRKSENQCCHHLSSIPNKNENRIHHRLAAVTLHPALAFKDENRNSALTWFTPGSLALDLVLLVELLEEHLVAALELT